MHVPARISMHMHAYIHTCTQMYLQHLPMCLPAYPLIHPIHPHTFIYAHEHTCVHTYVYTYTHTNIHIYRFRTCMNVCMSKETLRQQ